MKNKKGITKRQGGNAPRLKKEYILSQVTRSAPLPIPSELKEYNDIIPNGAERMMTMVEKEQTHNLSQSKKILEMQSAQGSRGQWFAFILGLTSIGLGGLLTYVRAKGWGELHLALPGSEC